MTFIYRFESELPPIVPLRLKIEINTREHFTVLGHVSPKHSVDNGWFRGGAEIRSYRLEELLGTKLRALFQRKKGRDLFDLGVALQDESLDDAGVVACFQEYIARRGNCVTSAVRRKSPRETRDTGVHCRLACDPLGGCLECV